MIKMKTYFILFFCFLLLVLSFACAPKEVVTPNQNGTGYIEVPKELATAQTMLSYTKILHDQVKGASIQAYKEGMIDEEERDHFIRALNIYHEVQKEAIIVSKNWLSAVQKGEEFDNRDILRELLQRLITRVDALADLTNEYSSVYISPSLIENIFKYFQLVLEVNNND